MSTSVFPSADEMREMIAPIARDAEAQLGSRVSLFTIDQVRRLDASYGQGPPVPVATAQAMKLKSVTLEIAQEVFGLDTDVRMTGKTSRATLIEPGLVVVVTSGDFNGQTFEVTKVVEKPLSDSYVLALKEHPALS